MSCPVPLELSSLLSYVSYICFGAQYCVSDTIGNRLAATTENFLIEKRSNTSHDDTRVSNPGPFEQNPVTLALEKQRNISINIEK